MEITKKGKAKQENNTLQILVSESFLIAWEWESKDENLGIKRLVSREASWFPEKLFSADNGAENLWSGTARAQSTHIQIR